MMDELKKNYITEAVVDAWSTDGGGICRIDGRAVFLPRAIPGENWRLRIVKANKTAVWARGEELLETSPEREDPACPHFGRCGGCATMHMSYPTELRFKLQKVNDCLRRIGGLELQAETILGADTPFSYRNKSIYNLAPGENGPQCGFYRNRSHEIVPAERCYLQPELFDRCAQALTQWMRENQIPAYDESNGQGLVRHLFLRRTDCGFTACVVATDFLPSHLTTALREACPELTGILLCRNKNPGNVALNEDIRVLWGEECVTAALLGARFRLSPLTFFQINTSQAEKLYSLVRDYAKPTGKTILDLYCGAGSIGISIARDAKQLIGSDIIPSAVENAAFNARQNGMENAEFLCGDASEIAVRLASQQLRPDVIIVDPPRKGLTSEVIEAVRDMEPDRVVYVSCDPATLARDLKHFVALGYRPQKAAAVDMFPRTSHVETVCLLSKLNTKQHIEINLDMDELDLTDAENKATYDEIKAYVLENSGMNVSNLYIAQTKRKCDIIERENYNLPKKENSKQPMCPPEKEVAIKEALKHFGMIKENSNEDIYCP